MGIDIYMGGYDAYNARTRNERAAFDKAVKQRDRLPRNSVAAKHAQELVEVASEKMWDGGKGYLRSSYNSGGLFNVLDRIFGIDSGALLFPGNWDTDQQVDWDKFIANVKQMQMASSVLRHGDPLPIQMDELQSRPNESRARGEAFGKAVAGMIGSLAESTGDLIVESGNDHAHGFFNDDDYGWYIREGLDDLMRFGELGKRLQAEGEDTHVHISY